MELQLTFNNSKDDRKACGHIANNCRMRIQYLQIEDLRIKSLKKIFSNK